MRLVIPPGVFEPPSDAYALARVLREHAPGRDVLDVCTGSGVLAVVAGLSRARSVSAVDVSRRALATARLNGALNRLRLRTRRSDLLDELQGARFDVIVSNPPYLPGHDVAPRGIERATEAGFDGRRFIDRLIDQAPRVLREGGLLLLVHSSINGTAETRGRMTAAGFRSDVALRRQGPLGPRLAARTALLEERGLLEHGQRVEEIVVVRGTLAR